MYQSILKVMLPKFKGIPLQKVTGIRVMKYLSWLRNDYRTNRGKPLADKSIRHHYNILRMIFNFAEKQEVIEKNPMKKVDAPRVSKKSVSTLTEEDASRFFEELKNCPLDFRCIMYVLRNPDAVTRHLKRFVKANGLPDVSPHDLRHTCASLLLSSGADIKSVQEILGHADASTTLNFYVKADLRQMRTATEKYAQAFNL